MKLTRRDLFKATGTVAIAPVLAALPDPGPNALGTLASVSENVYRYVHVVGGLGRYAEYVAPNQVRIRPELPKNLKKLAGLLSFDWPPPGSLKTDENVQGFAWILVRGKLP